MDPLSGSLAVREGSDSNDINEVFNAAEIVHVARVQRKVDGERRCGDQQVYGSGSAGFTSTRRDGRIDTAVSPRRGAVERQRVKGGLGSLHTVLTSRPLGAVGRCVWAGCQLRHRQGADRQFGWKLPGVQMIEVDQDRGVDEALRRGSPLSHGA
jgi:hypothetical protein